MGKDFFNRNELHVVRSVVSLDLLLGFWLKFRRLGERLKATTG